MANNEHINKVVKSTGETLIDLTSDTVTAGTLLKDVTAHDRSGAQITGTVIVAPTDVTETENNEVYLYKNSEHDAVYDELVGGSVAWNQLAKPISSCGYAGIDVSTSSDGVMTINGTATGNTYPILNDVEYSISGHKYYVTLNRTDLQSGINLCNDSNGVDVSNGKRIQKSTGSSRWYLRIAKDTVCNNVKITPQIIDLTQMFGSTIADYAYNLEQSTAGSGIAWLKSYGFCTKDYYPYNAGTLMSVNTSGKKVVGKNLLPKLFSTQTKSNVTLTANSDGTLFFDGTASSLEYFPINFTLAAGAYTFTTGIDESFSTYDTYLSLAGTTLARGGNGASNNFTLERESELQITFRIRQGIISDGLILYPMIRRADVTDPTFEPYTSITYPIQSTDLRGLYKLDANNKLYTDGDIYSADGQITRKYGIVDLGTLNWGMTTNNRFYANVEQGSTRIITNALCTKYVVTNVAFANLQDKQMNYGQPVVSANWRAVAVKDSAYTDAATFKTAMSGVYLIYELATPTTAPAPPFTSPQMVYRNGTEEYLDTRDVPIPVGGNRKYVDIPNWMINEYFDDLRAETSTISKIIEKLRRIDVLNGSSTTVRTIYAPDANTGIRTTVRNNRTEVQVACGQASNANGKVVFTDSRIWGGIGNPTSISSNHFMFNDDCGGDSIGKLSSGSPLTGSEFNLNYETINLKGSTININDNMSMAFETENDFTVNTINTPYMMINTDGISLLPKTLSYFPLLISRLPSGAGSELVVDSNGTVYKSSSSRDIKHDIQYIENTESYHDALMQIKPATYVYNNDKTETAKLGMIAEDIADVMPIAALTGEGGKVENYDTRAIIAMLVMEVQRLNAEIERLRGDSNAN